MELTPSTSVFEILASQVNIAYGINPTEFIAQPDPINKLKKGKVEQYSGIYELCTVIVQCLIVT